MEVLKTLYVFFSSFFSFPAVTWLKYCRYGFNLCPIKKSIFSFFFIWSIHKTKRHYSVKNERRQLATFQWPFNRLNGRYNSVTIQSTEWQVQFSDHSVTIQSPFRRLSVTCMLTFLLFRILLILYALFFKMYDHRWYLPRLMSEYITHYV